MTEKRFVLNKGFDTLNVLDMTKFDEQIYVNKSSKDMGLLVDLLNNLHDENHKIKSLLLNKVEELNNAYNKSARAGMPTGGIIGELDSFEEICRIMGWIE